MLCTMPMHHGAGPAVAWGALRLGNLLILQRRFDPEETLKLIEKHRVTVWTGVPTMYKRLAGLAKDVLAKYDVSSIRSWGWCGPCSALTQTVDHCLFRQLWAGLRDN